MDSDPRIFPTIAPGGPGYGSDGRFACEPRLASPAGRPSCQWPGGSWVTSRLWPAAAATARSGTALLALFGTSGAPVAANAWLDRLRRAFRSGREMSYELADEDSTLLTASSVNARMDNMPILYGEMIFRHRRVVTYLFPERDKPSFGWICQLIMGSFWSRMPLAYSEAIGSRRAAKQILAPELLLHNLYN